MHYTSAIKVISRLDSIDWVRLDLLHCAGSVGDMLPKQVNIQEKGAGRQTQLIDTQVPTSSHVIHQMFGGKQLRGLHLANYDFCSTTY